jgi:hypothetical protein
MSRDHGHNLSQIYATHVKDPFNVMSIGFDGVNVNLIDHPVVVHVIGQRNSLTTGHRRSGRVPAEPCLAEIDSRL